MSAGFEDLLDRVRRGGGGGGGGREEQREAVPWLQILLEMLSRKVHLLKLEEIRGAIQ